MKKYISFLMILIFCLCASSVSLATDENAQAILNRKVSIVYNNELKEFSDVNGTKVYPLTYQGTTYLPVRAIASLFSIPVEWNGAERMVLLGSGDVSSSTVKTIQNFISGENEEITLLLSKSIKIKYNGILQKFTDVNGTEVFPLLYKDTTYLPVRAISNMYGASVEWDEINQRITLIKEDKIAKITDVIIKVASGTLFAEIKTSAPIDSYKNYVLAEGVVKAEPYLNMRAEMNTSAEILAKIPDKTTIDITNVLRDSSGYIWYQTSFEGVNGFVSASYITVNSARMVIDLEESVFATSTATQEINYDIIKAIRFGVQENDTNRIVLDLEKLPEYTITQSADKLTTYMALVGGFKVPEETAKDYVLIASIADQIFLPESERPQVKPDDNVDVNQNPNKDDEAQENEKQELTEEQIKKMAKVTSVTYSSTTDKIKVNISGRYDFEKFMLENPTRLVIDISNALLQTDGIEEITPKNKSIKEIRFAQNEIDKVRVVIELNNAVDYTVKEKTAGLEITIEEPEYRNIEYKEYNDYAELILKDVKKKVFDTTETARTNKYTITYSSSKFDSGKADLEIDDDFIETITIRTNKITLKATGKMSYSMKQVGDDVVVTISEKADDKNNIDGKFVVLLDAGHGGSDPGACHNGGRTPEEQEKTYTLAVMLKIKELLEDEEDIEVRTSRTKDVFIDREGRIDYVLDNEDADLLVSVHINSHSNSIYNGTLVLYYNKAGEKEDYGITSKELATLVKNNIVEATGLMDKGIVSRKDLWILEQNDAGNISDITGEDRPVTNLPAILCELCFISNEEDFAKLQTEEFQDAAAEAIYEGILEAKEQMGK